MKDLMSCDCPSKCNQIFLSVSVKGKAQRDARKGAPARACRTYQDILDATKSGDSESTEPEQYILAPTVDFKQAEVMAVDSTSSVNLGEQFGFRFLNIVLPSDPKPPKTIAPIFQAMMA